MKKPRIQTSMNYDFKQNHIHINFTTGKTVPDMVLSIRDIMLRYTRGQPLPYLQAFNSTEDLSDFQNLDVFQRLNLARQFKLRKEVLQTQINEQRASDARLKAEKDFNDRLQSEINKQLTINKQQNEK